MRKSILLFFAGLGSISSILFLAIPSSSPLWPFTSLLAITANVSFGVSIVCLNSYLPQLARSDPAVKEAYGLIHSRHGGDHGANDHAATDELGTDGSTPEEQALLSPSVEDTPVNNEEARNSFETYSKLVSRATSRISSRGIAIGYGAGIALLILLLVPVTLLKGSTFALRLSISLTGAWWLVFTIPAALWLPGRSSSDVSTETSEAESATRQIMEAWRRLAQMLRPSEIKKLKNTFWFLLAWFLLSDGMCIAHFVPSLYLQTIS